MKQRLILFAVFLLILAFVFRSLLVNFSEALVDWRDYALMVWIIFQNMSKILSLNFQNYFDTNTFYPHHYSLLFSDLLLPQSILSLPFYILTRNLILSFNLVFILTFILNYISSFLFWKQIFKKDILAFFGSLLIIFSPFFHLENSHFQMMSYWPFFFSLYFLLKAQSERKYFNSIISGVFLAIQFMASVYLSVYLLVVIALFNAVNFSRKNLKVSTAGLALVLITFLLLSGVFIKGYFDMKKEHNIKRNLEEYVTYSAHLSDYIFTSSINSVIHKSTPAKKWNGNDKNGWGGHASFPGFLVFFTALIGMFILVKDKKEISLNLKINRQKAFFISVMLLGFIFSLGPRLNFNGQYAFVPLPYTLALKTIPLVEATRVPARWSFLVFFGLTFFALIGLNKISQNNKYRNYIFGVFFIIFVLEYIPLNLTASVESYSDSRDELLEQICKNKKEVVLELPVTHLNADTNIADGLSYITKRQLASTIHNCFIVNGYSGYDLKENFELSDKIDSAISSNNVDQFVNELKQKNITIVKFNPDHFHPTKQVALDHFLKSLDESSKLKKLDTTIFSVDPD